eukprot:CAMPEP_0177752794 /NCGR_PEP_ID=MMETSP0491_2-20121128/1106_1 /TAXON_ID=63592 /ORGANISM="Tetraselmis chuii, Strain PLY429" /LENGTH=293 /DNA_ID=CAMNT_0019268015 /DNA_START=44 /DNA_END=925 /DNA_ORIENTATION=+
MFRRVLDVDHWCDCRSGRFWASLLGLLSAMVAVSGIVLVPVGQRWHFKADQVTPDVDFISLGRNCRVVDVQTVEVSQQLDRNDGHGARPGDSACFHHHTYSFVYAGTGAYTFDLSATYKSSTERVRVYTGECELPPVRPITAFSGSMSVGQRCECWAPVVPGPPPRADLYHCGSPDCLKIFHPAGEVEAELNKSNEYILAGAVCIAVGLLGILMSVAMWKMFGSSSGAHLASAAGRGHQVAIPVQALTYVTVISAVTASSTASTPSDDVAGSYSPPITSPLQDGRTVPSSSLV